MASLSFVPVPKLIDLLNTADPTKSMYLRVLSMTRLAVGADPLNPSAVIDLAKEKIVPFSEESIKAPEIAPAIPVGTRANIAIVPDWRASRRGGEYWYELKDQRADFRSLKDLLGGALLAFETASPGTLEKLSHIKPRSRRIVSRDPNQLFDKGHLAKEYAEKLGNDGWFYGTNNSAHETSAWLERACSCAGFGWGVDFKTNLYPSVDDL
jgi:hypothetical protein